MINGAIANLPFPPSTYAGFANAVVGKPLASVNVGISLELAAPAQNPLGDLLAINKGLIDEAAYQAQLEKYSFMTKIGDATRTLDDMVGYYDADNATDGHTDWTTLYTYFMPEAPNPTRVVKVDESSLPTLRPYYLHLER
jgi:hypothetical protein